MLCTFGLFILRNLLFSFNWMLRVLEKELHKTIINGWWVHRDGSSFLTWILLCVTIKLPVWQQRAVSVCPLCLPAPSSSAASTAPCWAHGLGLRGTAEMSNREHRAGTGRGLSTATVPWGAQAAASKVGLSNSGQGLGMNRWIWQWPTVDSESL